MVELHSPEMFVGVLPSEGFQQSALTLPPGSALCVFSDGVFEIALPDGGEWSLAGFRESLAEEAGSVDFSADGMYRKVASLARHGKIEDDFSLMILRFD